MLRKIHKSFSSSKYFLDDKYQNFSLTTYSKQGSLSEISNIFAQVGANFTFIKSRFSNSWTDDRSYTLDLSVQKLEEQQFCKMKEILASKGIKLSNESALKVPWFPRNIDQLNKIGKVLLDVKEEANMDHPQFADPEYRKRRDFIAEIAKNYKMGDDIMKVPYTNEQNALWRRIYAKLSQSHKTAMSSRYLKQKQELQKQFLISQRIPQLSELDVYLKNKTGFQIKPTHGILSQRQFLNCFAFKTFCCTQYIRHTSTPQYTPQPDIVHEIVGHVPMFADSQVADLSHKIGLLSLGATDEQIAMLGTLYWFTLQFGACLQGKERLGYGAGIASSIGEIDHFISGSAKFKKFNPKTDCTAAYPIQTVQETYRVTESFNQALLQLQQFGREINKPISTTYHFKNKEIQYDRHIEAIDLGDKGPTF